MPCHGIRRVNNLSVGADSIRPKKKTIQYQKREQSGFSVSFSLFSFLFKSGAVLFYKKVFGGLNFAVSVSFARHTKNPLFLSKVLTRFVWRAIIAVHYLSKVSEGYETIYEDHARGHEGYPF